MYRTEMTDNTKNRSYSVKSFNTKLKSGFKQQSNQVEYLKASKCLEMNIF